MKTKSLILAALLLPLATQAQIAVWMSPNDVESASAPSATITGVATETFTSAFGTVPSGVLGNGASYSVTGTSSVQTSNQFGGISTGNYLKSQGGSVTTLALSTPAAYFGIYYTAADAFNEIVISNMGTTLLTYDSATLLTKLNNGVGTVTAINGNVYNTADYFGRPVSGTQNPTQAYAYLHFIADSGVTFDKIELKQRTNGSGSAFESDNHSILTNAPIVPGSLVPIPEPSSLLLSLSAFGSFILLRKRN